MQMVGISSLCMWQTPSQQEKTREESSTSYPVCVERRERREGGRGKQDKARQDSMQYLYLVYVDRSRERKE